MNHPKMIERRNTVKIAIICTEMNPLPPVIGGAIQVYIDGMLPYLSNNYQMIVLSVNHEGLPNHEIRDGIAYYRFPKEGYSDHVADHLSNASYNILHIFNRPLSVPKYHEASPQSKIILSLHNEMFAEHKISNEMGQNVIDLCDTIITISKFIKETVITRFPEAESKTIPIYSAVDIQRYRPYWMDEALRKERNRLRKEYGLENRKVILFVGRLSIVKGVDVLISAMEKVAAEFPQAVLVIVGSKRFGSNPVNDYVESLYSAAENLQNHIQFTRFIVPSQLPYYYAMGDIFVNASQWQEPLARVHYEAMAAGLPIITTERGGNGEVIDPGWNGILLSREEYNQPEAFAREIVRLLQHDNYARALAYAGRHQVATTFTFQRLAKQISAIYRNVMRSKSR